MTNRYLLLALLGLLLVARAVNANDAEGEERPDDNEESAEQEPADTEKDPNAVAGVISRAYFANYQSLEIPAGDKIDTLLAFTNAPGNPTYTILFAVANLHNMGDFNNYVMNFSGYMYNRTSQPGETSTLAYSFTPDEQLEPREYALVIRVFFQKDDLTFYATSFNGTITIAEPSAIDYRLYFTLAAIVAGAGYAANRFLSKRQAAAPAKKVLEKGTSGTEFEADFVGDDHKKYAEFLAKKGGSPKGSPKRSSSK